jgi:hypothetical protein
MVKERVCLGTVSDGHVGVVLDALATQEGIAGIGQDVLREKPDERGFACPRWTQNRDDLSLRHVEADVSHGHVERVLPFACRISLAQPLQRDRTVLRLAGLYALLFGQDFGVALMEALLGGQLQLETTKRSRQEAYAR